MSLDKIYMDNIFYISKNIKYEYYSTDWSHGNKMLRDLYNELKKTYVGLYIG